MDPISFGVELELSSLLLAAVGGLATLYHNRQVRARRAQRERHHRDLMAMYERHHRERMMAMGHGTDLNDDGASGGAPSPDHPNVLVATH